MVNDERKAAYCKTRREEYGQSNELSIKRNGLLEAQD